jgi:hypothetical protein
MRIGTTIGLGLIAIALGFAIASVNRPDAGIGSADSAKVLVRFPAPSIGRVVIEKGDAKVALVNRAGFWFFAEPEQDRVDGRILAALMDELNHLTLVDEIGQGGSGLSREEMGIAGESAIRISLTGKSEDGDSIEEAIVLGNEAPRADSLYASRGSDSSAFVVDGNPRDWLEQPLATLRESRLISAPPEAIVQIGIRRPTGELVTQRRLTPPKQDWALLRPIQTWASPGKMDELLTDLAGIRIEEVLRDTPSGEAIPDPLPDGAAVLQLRVYGIEQPLTVYLEQVEAPPVDGAPAVIEARVSDRPAVYRFRSTILGDLPGEADDLRDRTLARIPAVYLESVTIQSPIDPFVYLKSERVEEGMRWDVKVNNKLLPANLTQVSALLSAVNEATILDFASDTGEDLTQFGLRPPARRITFLLNLPGVPNEDGSPGQVQTLERVLDLGWKEGEEERLYANFEGEPHVYELDPSFLGYIPTHPIKWRSLNVLSINRFHLRSITRELPEREKLKLTYNYQRDSWEASRNGIDVTPSLDITSARKLRDRLGSLTATGWYLSLANANEALQSPIARFVIVTKELDPARGDAVDKTYTINIAPAAANLYYGQVEGSLDVFILDHETYGELIRPVTTARAAR